MRASSSLFLEWMFLNESSPVEAFLPSRMKCQCWKSSLHSLHLGCVHKRSTAPLAGEGTIVDLYREHCSPGNSSAGAWRDGKWRVSTLGCLTTSQQNPSWFSPRATLCFEGVDVEKLHVLMKRMVNVKKSLRRSSGRVWKNPQVWKYGR